MPGFGHEEEGTRGILHTQLGKLSFRGRVETLPGDWGILFQNLADSILQDAPSLISLDDILEQMRILEQIKR
jgi:scyllo-inositol 2-dehydrogenase (NADP+)